MSIAKPFRLLCASAIVAGSVSLVWMVFAHSDPLPAGANRISTSTRDGPRTAIILPAGRGPHPTVIVLHGGSGTAEEVAHDTGFAEAAARRNFTAVFAQGLWRQWQDGRVGRSGPPDDVAFLAALGDRLARPRLHLRDLKRRLDELCDGVQSRTPVSRPGNRRGQHAGRTGPVRSAADAARYDQRFRRSARTLSRRQGRLDFRWRHALERRTDDRLFRPSERLHGVDATGASSARSQESHARDGDPLGRLPFRQAGGPLPGRRRRASDSRRTRLADLPVRPEHQGHLRRRRDPFGFRAGRGGSRLGEDFAMIAGINARRSGGAAQPWLYFALVQILSIPFYRGVLTPLRGFPFYGWPVSVAAILVPATVATVLTAREQGGHAALHLWSRIGDVRRIRGARWVLFALLMPPAVAFVAYGIVRYFHLALPAVVRFTPAAAPGYFTSFFIGAIPEEIGWTGYATEPLQRRYGVIRAGLIIGGFWALWHVAMWWVGGGWEGRIIWLRPSARV